MAITYNLTQNISFLLSYRNLSQDDFGKLIGTKGKNVSNWINNIAKPPVDKLFSISKEFNLSLDTLVFGDIKDLERELSGYRLKENETDMMKGKNGENGAVNKDQLIVMLQDRVKFLESELPETIDKVINSKLSQLTNGQDVLGKSLLNLSLLTEEIKEKVDKK